MTKTKTAFKATFANGQVVELAASVKPYSHAFQVQFQHKDGEWDVVNGFATDAMKADKAARAWVSKLNKTWNDRLRKMVACNTPTKVEIVEVQVG